MVGKLSRRERIRLAKKMHMDEGTLVKVENAELQPTEKQLQIVEELLISHP